MRRFVIGDIHGCAKALRTVLESIDPEPEDQIIFLGDYIDRGPDSRNVIDQILALSLSCEVIPLRGNHEIMLAGVALNGLDPSVWIKSGGQATISSYGGSLDKIPADHWDFIQGLLPYHESADDIFVHAGYNPDVAMNEQDDASLYWNHLTGVPLPHESGKRVIVGHTPQASGEVLDLGHLICMDTYCFGGGYLTALRLDEFDLIQANRHGHLRRTPFSRLSDRIEIVRDKIRSLFGPPRRDQNK